MDITTRFETTSLADLDLAPFGSVAAGSSLCDAVGAMNRAGATCAVIGDVGPFGILTDRDVSQNAVGHPEVWDRPVTEFMTSDARSLPVAATVLDAIELMNEQRFRHVIAVTESGNVSGIVSDTCLVKVIDALLHDEAVEYDHEPGAQHGLLFVDFTGLAMTKPVTVRPSDSLESAMHHIRARAIGSVLVCDERGSLVGVLTERDLLRKVACRQTDLSSTAVGEHMTPDPVALSPRAMIADGFAAMARDEFTHLPLVAESGRPVGIVSFRDLADYLETNVAAST